MPKRLKDVDAGDRAIRLKALVWASFVGIFGGLPIGSVIAVKVGIPPMLGLFLGLAIGFGGVYYGSLFITRRAARVAQTVYNPSGESTPRRREYSKAAALVMQDKHEDAAAAYEVHLTENPDDPEPYFQLARLSLEHLGKPEEAIQWYTRARDEARLTAGQALIATQEIVNIYVRKLRTPRKAIPELKLLCERFEGTPAAEVAQRELDEMRALLVRESEEGVDFTEEFLKRFDRDGPHDEAPPERLGRGFGL
jgi:tetratricopeptide (TPR) repeat protein